MKKSISIIIPNYNGKHLLEAYLPSVLVAIHNADVDFQLIIVDDASKDDSVTFLQENYPQIILEINEQNQGFSYTCNIGIKKASKELCLLLNSDVRLTPDYFEHQFSYFSKPDTFGVMGRIMSADGNNIEDAARILFYNGCRIKANTFYYSQDQSDTSVYTAYLSGANALVRTCMLKELNGFDEIFSPFSSEDSDLSTRAWLLGWKCYYEHRAICFHQVSGSTKTQIKSDFIKKIYYRNRFVFHKIHLNGGRLSIWPIYLMFLEILPKLVVGKSWILDSYQSYRSLSPQIKASRDQITTLQRKYHSTLKVDDIIKTINKSIALKSVERL
ncbi:MAG: glycosyltransferase family 2 protein [Flavobacterium sp.]|nr:MAG: glycosyltransferase family 2 protein [Flavobacterium sp.]